jgi:hypothetical protein
MLPPPPPKQPTPTLTKNFFNSASSHEAVNLKVTGLPQARRAHQGLCVLIHVAAGVEKHRSAGRGQVRVRSGGGDGDEHNLRGAIFKFAPNLDARTFGSLGVNDIARNVTFCEKSLCITEALECLSGKTAKRSVVKEQPPPATLPAEAHGGGHCGSG